MLIVEAIQEILRLLGAFTMQIVLLVGAISAFAVILWYVRTVRDLEMKAMTDEEREAYGKREWFKCQKGHLIESPWRLTAYDINPPEEYLVCSRCIEKNEEITILEPTKWRTKIQAPKEKKIVKKEFVMTKCDSCGSLMPETSTYCLKCGKKR